MYDKMKHIGFIVAQVFDEMKDFLKPGITTRDIEIECVRLLKLQGAKSSCKGYRGFPGELCVSVNNEVCHGIPSAKRIIRKNDLVSIDIVANKNGYNGDSCVTFLVGECVTRTSAERDNCVSFLIKDKTAKTETASIARDNCVSFLIEDKTAKTETASIASDNCKVKTASVASDNCVSCSIENQPVKNDTSNETTINNCNTNYNNNTSTKSTSDYSFFIGDAAERTKIKIIKATYECMWNAISHIKAGIKIGDLGYLMESYANKLGYTVVRDFCGHGISVNMHENPQVPFYGRRNTGEILQAGTCITIEPMLVLGSPRVDILGDDWTAITKGISCQFEHTVWIHENGYEVITYNKYDAHNGKLRSNV